MSNYTMELRHMLEHYAGLSESEIMFSTPAEIISASRTRLFDFDYPLYDPDHKEELETKIMEHYYLREIGGETPGMFKLFLARTMREIMPYFNKLYYSAALEYNPLDDVNVRREHVGHASGVSSSEDHKTGNTSGTTANMHVEDREIDETVNTEGTENATGQSAKATHTETETDTETNSTGSKTSQSQYSDEDTNRNAYSATPESTINGVEGQGGSSSVSEDYWLTDYRKIHDYKHGDSQAEEHTTGHETGHSESSGDSTENVSTTDHKETTGQAVTDRNEHATVTDNGQTTGTSSENATGSAGFQNADDWIETVTGKQGSASYASMILEYRETILNIDMMIIEALEPCFMQIF